MYCWCNISEFWNRDWRPFLIFMFECFRALNPGLDIIHSVLTLSKNRGSLIIPDCKADIVWLIYSKISRCFFLIEFRVPFNLPAVLIYPGRFPAKNALVCFLSVTHCVGISGPFLFVHWRRKRRSYLVITVELVALQFEAGVYSR